MTGDLPLPGVSSFSHQHDLAIVPFGLGDRGFQGGALKQEQSLATVGVPRRGLVVHMYLGLLRNRL
jgi:hypothetical protein